MELVNIFLDSESGRVKILLPHEKIDGECSCRLSYVTKSIDYFVKELDKYLHVNKSSFYLAIRDKDLFVFRLNRGSISLVQNEYFLFDDNLLFTEEKGERILGVEFLVTGDTPVRIVPRDGISVLSSATYNKYYDKLI